MTGQFQNGGAGICCVPLLTTGNLDESKNLAKKGQSNWGGLINPVLTLHGKAPTSEIVHQRVWTNGILDKFKCWFEVSALSSVPVRRGGGPRVKRCNSQQIWWVLGTWVSFLGASGKVLSHSWEACPAAMWSPTHLATAVQSAPVKKPAEVFGTLRLICPWNQTETLWVTVWLGLVDFGYIYMEVDGNGTCFSCSLEMLGSCTGKHQRMWEGCQVDHCLGAVAVDAFAALICQPSSSNATDFHGNRKVVTRLGVS